MRNELGANSSVSKVSFHHTEFALGAIFPLIELNSLALYCRKFTLMCSISINVSNNTRILEIDNGIVDEESGSGGRVENVKVIIFDPGAIEIGSRVSTCMEGNGMLGVATLVSPYKVSIDPSLSEGDIACHFVLPVLIEEDERVLLCITAVVLAPSNSWMVRIIKLLGKLRNVGDGTGCGGEGDGRVVCGKPDWFITLHVVVRHVALDFVKNLGNEKKVFNRGVITEGGGEHLVVKLSVPQNVQGWEEILRPSQKRPSDMPLMLHVLQQGSALFSHMANLCQRGNLSR